MQATRHTSSRPLRLTDWWRPSSCSTAKEETLSKDNPRIAVLGFAIECNRFSPVSTKEDFETDVDIRGNRIVAEARAEASITLPDLPGFFAEMDRSGPWTPVPLRVSQAQPGGPVEETVFKGFLAEIE